MTEFGSSQKVVPDIDEMYPRTRKKLTERAVQHCEGNQRREARLQDHIRWSEAGTFLFCADQRL